MRLEFISIEEIAERCKISHVTALKYLKEKTIPGRMRHLGTHRVDRVKFEAWFRGEQDSLERS